MTSTKEQHSYTPFPDLTGWRTSSSSRGSSSDLTLVSCNSGYRVGELHEAARQHGPFDAADLLVAAWAIILVGRVLELSL